MAEDKVAMPGDADESGDKIAAQTKNRRAKNEVSGGESKAGVDAAVKESEERDAALKGPFSPAQHEDDGWGDTPVQMRGGDDEQPAQVGNEAKDGEENK